VFVDGKSVGTVPKGKPFLLPGLAPGQHTVKGVHQGFEPDGPREETVYPGTESTVNIKLLIPRRRSKQAEDKIKAAEVAAAAQVRAAAADAATKAAETVLKSKAKGEFGDELIDKGIADLKRLLH